MLELVIPNTVEERPGSAILEGVTERHARHPFLGPTSPPRLIAHRGFVPTQTTATVAGPLTENTRVAFELALAHGATHLETDCHVTADGRVVLFHDFELTRITGEDLRVAEVTHTELAARMADRGGLLTLDEALDVFPRARFNVDVKAAAGAEEAGRIIAPHAGRVLLTSFSDTVRRRAFQAAQTVRAQDGLLPASSPGRTGIIRTLAALATRSERLIASALAGFDALQIPERQGKLRVLTPRLIEAAHRHGVEVHVWTVNDPARMRALVHAGVDGIVTDRIDLAAEAFATPTDT